MRDLFLALWVQWGHRRCRSCFLSWGLWAGWGSPPILSSRPSCLCHSLLSPHGHDCPSPAPPPPPPSKQTHTHTQGNDYWSANTIITSISLRMHGQCYQTCVITSWLRTWSLQGKPVLQAQSFIMVWFVGMCGQERWCTICALYCYPRAEEPTNSVCYSQIWQENC